MRQRLAKIALNRGLQFGWETEPRFRKTGPEVRKFENQPILKPEANFYPEFTITKSWISVAHALVEEVCYFFSPAKNEDELNLEL